MGNPASSNEFRARTIIRSPDFESQAASLHRDVARIDEVMIGAEWALARCPSLGMQVVKTRALGGLPEFTILANVEDESVTLLSISAD